MARIAPIFIVALLTLSCGRDKVRVDGIPSQPVSTGAVMEIVAVVDSSLYSEQTTAALYKYLSPVMHGLPQKERQGRLYVIPRSSFSRTYRTMRNLVLVERSDSLPGMIASHDVYAAPQNVFTVKAPDRPTLLEQLEKSGPYIFGAIRQNAIETLQEKFARIDNRHLKTVSALGIGLNIPNYYHVARSEKDFVWLTRDISKNGVKGTANLMIYKTRYGRANDIPEFTHRDILDLRDTVARRYVHGPADGSYMAIEKKAVLPLQGGAELSGIPVTATYGFWRTQGDFMGGPFINYCAIDPSKGVAYCADGFVYLPFEEKGAFMLEMEAILRTFTVPSLLQK